MPQAVAAAVVVFRPEADVLAAQRAATLPQVAELVYVDNGGARAALAGTADAHRVRVLGDGRNAGLASGLNVALRDARERGHRYCLLLDQDSIPSPGMVAALLRAFGEGASVLASGPAILDELSARVEDFARLRVGPNLRIRAGEHPRGFFDVDFLITSGTLVRLDLLDAAGWMDEGLFIDSIDFDWSFRARSRGFRLLATFETTLSHRRGDHVHRLPGGLPLRIHSATRLYYMHRNRVRLYRRPYVPVAWKVHDLARMLVKAGLLALFVPGRRARLAAIGTGLRDGLRR